MDLESRTTALEQKHNALEQSIGEDLKELLLGLKGNADKPGMFENVRKMQNSIQTLSVEVAALRVEVDKLKETKQQMIGACAACSVIGGVLGFLISTFIK